MKRQRIVWLTDKDWKKVKQKIESSGFTGRGSFERFLEKVSRCRALIFLESGENVSLDIK